MRTMCSREIFTKKCRQQQIFDSDLKGAWHYNHVTFTPIAKNFMLYCRLINMLSILCVSSSKGGDTRELQSRMVPPPPKKKKTGSSHLKLAYCSYNVIVLHFNPWAKKKNIADYWPYHPTGMLYFLSWPSCTLRMPAVNIIMFGHC